MKTNKVKRTLRRGFTEIVAIIYGTDKSHEQMKIEKPDHIYAARRLRKAGFRVEFHNAELL